MSWSCIHSVKCRKEYCAVLCHNVSHLLFYEQNVTKMQYDHYFYVLYRVDKYRQHEKRIW